MHCLNSLTETLCWDGYAPLNFKAIIRGSEIEIALKCGFGKLQGIFTVAVLGGIAQLGERLHGMQEVSSSILLTSTKISGEIVIWISPQVLTPSSRGLGHHPFTVSTGVRIPVGSPSL